MAELSREDLRELLVKGWMTHDAMWLMHCLQEVGMEKTNLINRRAVKSMAMIEAKRIAQALGVKQISNFDQLKSFVLDAEQIIIGKFMGFNVDFEEPNIMHCRMTTCFAHDGIQRLGVIEQYDCGIFERIDGWFEGLGLPFQVEPKVDKCMMHTDGVCYRDYTFDFSTRDPKV